MDSPKNTKLQSTTSENAGISRIINEDTPEIPPTDQIPSWIDEQIKHYQRMEHRDELLWEDFRADFARWKTSDFKKLPRNKRGELRSFLRNNGVYVSMTEVISVGLTMLLDEEKPTEWPEAELMKIANDSKNFNSWKNPILRQKPDPMPEPSSISGQDVIGQLERLLTNKQQASGSLNISQFSDFGRSLQNLSKIYLKEDKYGGAEDVLDIKLLIFYANCFTVGVKETEYPAAFSTMLKDEARTYYFTNVAGKNLGFLDVVNKMKAEFETEQRQERKTTEWENIKLIEN